MGDTRAPRPPSSTRKRGGPTFHLARADYQLRRALIKLRDHQDLVHEIGHLIAELREVRQKALILEVTKPVCAECGKPIAWFQVATGSPLNGWIHPDEPGGEWNHRARPQQVDDIEKALAKQGPVAS